MSRRALLVGALLAGLSAPILAQPAPKPGMSAEEKRQRAIDLFTEAEKFYAVQEWQRALDLYKESYLLSVEPALLYNIGQCQRQLKKYEEALKSYRAFIRGAPSHPSRADAETKIAELEPLLASQPKPPTSQPGPSTSQPSSGPSRANDGRTLRLAFLGASGGGVVVGGLAGLGAVGAAREARQQQAESAPDLDAVADADTRARRLALVSDALFVVGGLAGLGALFVAPAASEQPRVTPTKLFLAAGGAAGAGVALGLAARASALEAARLQGEPGFSQEQVAGRQAAAVRLGLASDLFFVAAVAGGAGGAFLSLTQEKPRAVRATVRPAGLALTMEF